MFQLKIKEMEEHLFDQAISVYEVIPELPLVFTETGAAMLSCILNSEKAVEINIRLIREMQNSQ
jgi:hypothetical protein